MKCGRNDQLTRRKNLSQANVWKNLSDVICDDSVPETAGTPDTAQRVSRSLRSANEEQTAESSTATLLASAQGKEASNVNGRRIPAIGDVLSGIDTLCAHSQACFPPKFISEVRTGLVTSFKYLCHKCGATFLVGEKKEQSDLNHQAVHASVSTGSGYSAMKEHMACMQVPFMAFSTFSKLESVVAKVRTSTFFFFLEMKTLPSHDTCIQLRRNNEIVECEIHCL